MDPLQAKANYSRICQLLVDKGGDALRSAFRVKHPPSTLAAVLNSKKSVLNKIRYSVISHSQWSLLFPASGAPDSKNFDITLLTILLRNICGLSSPTTGWKVMPPAGDTSISADILRIKIFRNQVYHIASPQLDDTTFETLWKEISKPLVNLRIPQQDIDEAKVAPLSPEEEFYIEKLKQWKESEDDILSKLNEVERKVNNVQDDVTRLRAAVEYQIPSQIDKLAKFNFPGKIKSLCNKFQHGTRKWFFDELSSWFDDEQSRVMILTAGPGIGKSVLSAKVCELYKERHQLAACHFCDFKNSDYSNPHRILHSLASQMCDSIEGFRDKLTEVLRREHSQNSLSDAFRVLLSDPLDALDRRERVLIVVDALDESKTETKSDFLELISEKFPELPPWVKILISSRPELQVRKKLEHFNPVEILPDDCHHIRDLEHFFQQCLPNLSEGTVNSLISKCEGSFLYAYYLVDELQKRDLGIEPNLDEIVPKGISGFYEKQFKRLENGLLKVIPDTASSILKSFVNIVAASKDPLPIKILFTGMGLSNQDYQVREIIISVMSEILPLYEDCLTVYHKSLWDWLRLNGRGYEEHAFVAHPTAGVHCLWLACKSVYKDIDSLSSTSHFQVTPEKMFALQNGGQYLLDVGDADDFHWLVHIRLNFLKLMYFGDLNDDISHMLRFYKSKRPNCHYWKIIHLEFFISKTIRGQHIDLFLSSCLRDKYKKRLFYLHSLANGYFDFMQRSDRGKNEAQDILNEYKELWVEEIGNEYILKNKVISHAILGENRKKSIWGMNDGMALSSDKKLLAYKNEWYFEVFSLPSFKLVFDLEMDELRRGSTFLLFSPDSSHLLWNSVRFCISLRERKVVPFIPHGPNDIDCCSFSSCGKKMVSFEKNLVKVWDLRKKTVLVQAELESEVKVELCMWSDCNLYFLVWHSERFSLFGLNREFGVLKATSLEWLNIKDLECADSCLNDEDDYQIVYPSRCKSVSENAAEFQIRHFHLPSSGIILIPNRFGSQPFMWKDKKCVIFFIFSRIAVVYDCINKEVVEKFCINCLPGNRFVTDITHLEGTNFFVTLSHNHAFVLSLENSMSSSVDHIQFFNASKIKCCAFSPDNVYVACCYENRILSIQRVDDGKTLQIILLKKTPKACWWSNSYLWVVCTDFVVKYTFDSAEVSGNALEDCFLSFKKVLRFMEGVLVVCLNNDKTAIYKICNQKLCSQEIPDSIFPASSAAISRDGRAVLLYCASPSFYQLLEITCENKWELSTEGSMSIFHVELIWFCLTGGKDSRCSIWVRSTPFGNSLSICSIDFPKGTKSEFEIIKPEHVHRSWTRSVVVEGTFPYTDILLIHRYDWIYFIKVSDGCIITWLYVGGLDRFGDVSSFYIPSKRMLVFVGSSEVKFLKIHNIESHLLCLEKD